MIRSDAISTLEAELNSTDAAVRRQAVEQLAERFRSGEAKCAPESSDHNMHCHTCYSYNGYGYSVMEDGKQADYAYYYPQAPTHLLFNVTFRF